MKRRNDRNRVIYLLTNTVTQEKYVGITVVSGRAVLRSLKERWKRHVHRAMNEAREWKLCKAIKEHGPKTFKKEILKVVRGKATAHQLERELITQYEATLNTF